MLKCNFGVYSLDSIKLVSDNLSERIKLDFTNSTDDFGDKQNDTPSAANSKSLSTFICKKHIKKSSKSTGNWCASLKFLDCGNPSFNGVSGQKDMTDMTMNSNLMFRSMFFMNEETTRHFLAPPLPPIQSCDIQSEYFQKKLISQGPSTSGSTNSVTTSSTNTGNISVPTISTGTAASCPKPPSVSIVPKQRPHNCEECGKTFLMKHHLSTHMRVHTGERPHICPECGKTFALKHCLSTHLLLHTAERPYKCAECNKSFTLKHHLVSHERVHTRDRPFECTECGQRFPQKRHLSTHIKFHSGERPFSCQVCGESFSREEHLVAHSRFHGGLSPYNCPDCGAGFLRKFELVNHERQHGRNPESCPNCGKEFLQKRTLLVHVRNCGVNTPTPSISQQSSSPSRYSEGTPPRFSDTPQRFSNDASSRFPSDSSSPRFSENTSQFRFPDGQVRFPDGTPTSPGAMQAPKDKVCKECGETFASVEGLALHLRLHFGDHSFLADICSLAASLKQTAVNVSAQLKKTHVCTDCGRGFTQRHGLFQHRQRHANGSCKEKPFSCEKCGKSFAQKNHLTLHERQHMDLPSRGSLAKKGPHSSTEENSRMDDQQIESTSAENQRSSQDKDRKEMERAMANSMMLQQNHPDHLLNRHPQESVGESSQVSQDNKEMERVMANSMMLHPDRQRVDLMNRHPPESHRSLNNPVPLIRMHNSRVSQSTIQQNSSNDRPMLPHHHHHHMGAAPPPDQIMPCLHPVPNKQY